MMGIVINNYTWEQNNKKVVINVPLTAASKDKLNVTCTANYLKVSKPPYMFETCLPNPVDHDATVVKLTDDGIIIHLTKLHQKRWNDIRQILTKDEMIAERQRAQEAVQKDEKEGTQRRTETRRDRERLSVSEQMRLDDVDRKSRDATRSQEKQQALAEVFRVNSAHPRQRRPSEVTVFSVSDPAVSDENVEVVDVSSTALPSQPSASAASAPTGTPVAPFTTQTSDVHATRSAATSAETETTPEPPVRAPGTISTAHTPRCFPTAARESRSEEEQAWLKKQAAAFQADGALTDKDLRPHEHDPRWLKERGDAFYQRGNYLAAVNAYSHAIHMSSTAPELYSNRAAAHLKLNNYHKTLEDSSSALDLLTPPVQANQPARLRCHVRRGTALLRLAAFREALAEYQMAASLDPANDKLAQDVETIKKLAEDDSEAEELVTLD